MITESFAKSCPAEFATSKRKEEIHMFGFPIVDVLESHKGFQTEGRTKLFCFQYPPDSQPASCCLIAPRLLKRAGIR